jgi:hypothetical protein
VSEEPKILNYRSAPTPAAPEEPAAAPALHDPPPEPPREVSAHVKNRAWNEPHVRFWRLLALAMLIVGAVFAVTSSIEWAKEVRLVKFGVPVDATIAEKGDPLGNRHIASDVVVVVRYKYSGKDYREEGRLPVPSGNYRNGGNIELRIDPNAPDTWTNRTTLPSFFRELLAAFLLLPIFIIAALISYLWYRRILRIWQRGRAEAVIVVDTRHTAIAPRSRVVRCTPRDRRESVLVSVFVPQRLTQLKTGDVIWLLAPQGKPNRAIAALVFQG